MARAAAAAGAGAGAPLGWRARLACAWFLLDGATHLGLEGLYLLLAFRGGAAHPRHDSWPAAFPWREYAKADTRWGVRDPTVMSLELLTVLLYGPLCLYTAHAVARRKPYRHFLTVCICVGELYGGWMTFCPEWLTGSPSLVTSDPVYLWVYLVFMNMVWVVIPGALLADSGAKIIDACERAKVERFDDNPNLPGKGTWLYQIVFVTLVAYAVLVPVVLIYASAGKASNSSLHIA